MTLKEHYQINIALATPVILSQVGHILVNVADSMMVGRLGALPLASVALAHSLFIIVMLFGLGMSYGMTPLVAVADGAGNVKSIASTLKHGFVLNTVLGLVLVAFCKVLGYSFPFLDQDPAVLVDAIPYFEVLTWSLLPLMIFQTFRQFSEGLSMTKQAMYISVFGNLLNIILNYGLIFGALGMPAYGVFGAGYATLISRVVMAILMGAFVLTCKKMHVYSVILNQITIKWDEIKGILKIGVPSGMQYLFEVGAFSMATIIIGWVGVIPLVAHQIALNLTAISYMTATGISAAATIRMGNQLGRKDYFTLRQAGTTCFVMVTIVMVVFALVFIFGKCFFPKLYVEDVQVIEITANLLVVAAFFQISDGIQAVGLGILRGLMDVKMPTYITLIAYWLLAIPSGYWLGITLGMGAKGVWYGLLIGLSVAAVAHLIRFHLLTKKMLSEKQPL